jgi:REP element-mobilizing transposase RayT
LRVVGGWVHQGQERDSPGAGVWGAKQNYTGQSFWARGYFVSTVDRDAATIRDNIRYQEQEDKRMEQFHMWK